MVRNIELAPQLYPGWDVIVYLHPDTPRFPVSIPVMEYTEIIVMDHSHELFEHPMLWRFLVADNPTVERFIVRDADSRLSTREADAVKEWISEDTILHVMRDHPAHAQPVLGGLWGAMWHRNDWEAPSMLGLIREYLATPEGQRPHRRGTYAEDQDFLHTKIWPWAKYSCTQHDSVCRNAYPGAKRFPSKRDFPRFVGEVVEVHFDGAESFREGDFQQTRLDE